MRWGENVAREGVGHRSVPHTADLRIEAWAPSVERCVAEAVRAMVGGFADVPPAAPAVVREFVVPAGDAAEQLVTVLDEVIYRMDTDGEIPRAVDVRREGADLRVALTMVSVAEAVAIGAVPKGVSLHRLRLDRDDGGWRCAVTLDV